MSEKNLNWAVLGTGVIANQMAAALEKMGRRLYAVGNRTHDKAVAPTLAVCPNCGAYYVYHTVCATCGYYRGKVAIVKEVAE